MKTTTENRVETQYLTFSLAGEEYGIAALCVREIIEYDAVTTVPGTPAYVRGVINLRGSVVPVLDLAVRFGMTASPLTTRTCIVIVEVVLAGESEVLGVLTDSVSQVINLAPEDVEDPPAFGTRVAVDHLLGVGKAGKKFVLLLDPDRILSSAELLAPTADPVAAQGETATR